MLSPYLFFIFTVQFLTLPVIIVEELTLIVAQGKTVSKKGPIGGPRATRNSCLLDARTQQFSL